VIHTEGFTMTAHNILLDCDVAMRSLDSMTLDEIDPVTMDIGGSACRVVSQEATADCHALPVATPVSAGTAASSDAMDANCITGRMTEIWRKYDVDARVIGTGHHGSVRECVDRATGQKYAVKSISKRDPSVKPGSLLREITLLHEMRHPSFVQLVDVFEDEEYVHLVTDLCTGGELFDRIVAKTSRSEGSTPCFSEDDAATVLYQILKAVSYMHKKGIVHRDIKPENILFETDDENSPIKIIDFGLARMHDGQHGEPPMTTIVGTPYYIAPDVLRRQYDKSCDLWSVGVIAYILMCGYPPFNGGSNSETHASILRGRYHFPSREWKHTSREARDFVRRLLQSDPSKRMTAEEALNHPWMAAHVRPSAIVQDQDARDDKPSEEAVVKGLRRSLLCGGLARRKIRRTMFGI